MKKGKLAKITALFLALMLCFTILSRAADQAGVAVVHTDRPSNMVITHQVRASGKVVQNQETAVVTEPDQRVTAIYVNEGDRVEKGDLLFEIDLTLLEEAILNQEQEMEKQKLQIEDAKSQEDVSAQQKANEQAGAAEQYSLSTQRAGVSLQRAREDLAEAKKALEDFRKKKGTSQEDSSVEEALQADFEEKSEAYIQAEQDLSAVEWQIEYAVNEALQTAKNQGIIPNPVTRTQSSPKGEEIQPEVQETILPEIQAEVQEPIFPETQEAEAIAQVQPSVLETGETQPPAEEILAETEPAAAAPFAEGQNPQTPSEEGQDLIIEDIETVEGIPEPSTETPETDQSQNSGETAGQSGTSEGNAGQEGTAGNNLSQSGTSGENPGQSGTSGGNSGQSGISSGNTDQGSSGSSGTPLSQAELDEVEAAVRQSWQSRLDDARKKVEETLAEKEAAQAALAQYQQERLAAEGEQSAEEEKQLISQVQAAQDAYEDAAIAANEAEVTGSRNVQQAGIPNPQNSAARTNELTYEQMELALEKLENLKKEGGKIYAPSQGLITQIAVATGQKTTDTTAILMADLSKGYRYTAEITQEQEEYVARNDEVTLTDASGKELAGLMVDSVTALEEEEGYLVTVQLPQDTELEIGEAATMTVTKSSAAYPSCVPLGALHVDERQQEYVLVPEEYDTVLGTQTRARRVDVTVLEKNETYAALQEGTLSPSQEIIVSSDKAVENESRVRIEE